MKTDYYLIMGTFSEDKSERVEKNGGIKVFARVVAWRGWNEMEIEDITGLLVGPKERFLSHDNEITKFYN